MVDLCIPSAPPAPLHPRRKTKQLKVGSIGVGSDSPVSVQSMHNGHKGFADRGSQTADRAQP